MKNRAIGFAAVILAIVMILPMLTACNKKTESKITVEVDGEQIVLDNTEGKTIAQLLEDAEIVLNKGDVLAVDPEQNADGNLTVKVLRRCSVLVENESEGLHCTVVLVGGTVADAIEAAGITLADDQQANFELDKALEDGMNIVITVKEPEEDGNAAATASSTQSYSGGKKSSSSSGSSSSSSSSSGSNTAPSAPSAAPSAPSAAPSAPSTAPSTAPSVAPSAAPSRSLVNVVDYPDPDGSGHGVKVYTYSDGSQEEVPY